MFEDEQGTNNADILKQIQANEEASHVNDLATRLSLGDDSAAQESKQGESSLVGGVKDLVQPFARGVADAAGSVAHLASSGLNAAGLSNQNDPTSLASKLDQAGEYVRQKGEEYGKGSIEKQVRDQANQIENKRMEEGGDYAGALANSAAYKSKHFLETSSELAGGLAPAIAATVATGGSAGVAALAAQMAAFAASSSGNTSYDVYKKYMDAPEDAFKAAHPEYAANPTPDMKERIARGAATQAGWIDAGINGPLGMIGPAGRTASHMAAAASAEGIVRSGLARIFGGGLTDAAKLAAANPIGTYAKSMAKDVGMFAGQAAGNQVNQNVADQGAGEKVGTLDGVATAVGSALPGAIAMGAHGARGERIQGKEAQAVLDEHTNTAQDLMAKEGLTRQQAMDVMSDDHLSGMENSQKLDVLSHIAKNVESEDGIKNIQGKKDAHVEDILSKAKDDVMNDRASTMDEAIANLKEDGHNGLHESHFDRAKILAKEEDVQAEKSSKIEAEKTASIDSGRSIAKEFSKKSSGKSFEEYAKESGLDEKAVADHEAYQQFREPKVSEAVDKLVEGYEKAHADDKATPEQKEKRVQANLNKVNSELKLGTKDVPYSEIMGVAKERISAKLKDDFDVKKKAFIDEATSMDESFTPSSFKEFAKRAENHMTTADLKPFKERMQVRADAEKVRITAERVAANRAAAKESKLAEIGAKTASAVAIENAKGDNKLKVASVVSEGEAAKADARKAISENNKVISENKKAAELAKVEALRLKAENAKAKKEEAAKPKAKLETPDERKLRADTEKLDATEAHLKETKQAEWKKAVEMLQAEYAKLTKDQLKATNYKEHIASMAEFKAKLVEMFPDVKLADGTYSKTNRNAVHRNLGKMWDDLKRSEGVKLRLEDNSKQVNGNIFAGLKTPEQKVMHTLAMLKDFPLQKLSKFMHISENMADAFSHDPERLKSMMRQAEGHNPAGMYDPESKTFHLFTDGIKSQEDLVRTVLHEITHRGLDILLDKTSREEYSRLTQRLMNGNSYVRKMTAELITSGRLKENDSIEHKLHETIAYMGEDISRVQSEMARGVFEKITSAIRAFVNKIIAKVAGQEYADKFAPGMSDHEVLDAVRKITNKGFEPMEGWVGSRFTSIDNGIASTNHLFRTEAKDRFSDSVGEFALTHNTGILGAIADMLRGVSDSRTKEFESSMFKSFQSSSHKAETDHTGELKRGVDVLSMTGRMKEAYMKKTMDVADFLSRMSTTDGSFASIGKELKHVAKWAFDPEPDMTATFIGKHLIEKRTDGHMKRFTDAEIASKFASVTHSLKPEALAKIQRAYKAKVDAAKSMRESVAGSTIKSLSDMAKELVPAASLAKAEALAIKTGDSHSRSVEEHMKAFESIAALAGDSSAMRTLHETVKTTVSRLKTMEDSGNLPLNRSGQYVVKASRQDGATLHRFQTDSKGEALNERDRIMKGLHIKDANERKAFLADLESKKVKIEADQSGDSKSAHDDHSSYANELDAINKMDISESKKREMIRLLNEGRAESLAAEIRSEFNSEDNARKIITGFDQNMDRNLTKTFESQSAYASMLAAKMDLTKAVSNASGARRAELVNIIEASRKRDSSVAQSMKGATYVAYLGGSVASALLQHFQQYMLAAPVMSQYMKNGGSFFKTQAAISKASFDIAKGWTKLEKGERKMLEVAIRDGYLVPNEMMNAAAFVSEGLGDKVKALGALSHATGIFMSSMEMNNRMATFLATHRLIKDGSMKMGEGHSDFHSFANSIVRDAHFDNQKYNRAAVERSDLGSLAFQFHMFPIRMLETVSRLPMRQKMEAMGVLLLLSGAGGLPFAGNIEDLVQAGSEWLGVPVNTKQKRVQLINSVLGDDIGRLANGGVLRGLGIEVGSRIGVGDIIPMLPALIPSNTHAKDEIASGMGASFSYANNLVSALQDLAKGNYRKAALTAAPTAVGNAFKGYEMATTGNVYGNDGMLIRKDASTGEAIAKGLGFNSDISGAYSEMKQFDNRNKDIHSFISQEYAKAFARAQINGDQSGMIAAQDKIKAWNMENMGTPLMIRSDAIKNAVRAMQLGMNMEEVDRKIKSSTGPDKLVWINVRDVMKGMKG